MFRSVGRAVMSFGNGLLTLVAALVALFCAALIVLTPKCPAVTPEYTVIATDVHGKLEYCVAEAQPVNRKMGMRHNVVHPGAACGPNKTELVEQAAALTYQTVEADKACNTRFLREPHRLILDRVGSWYKFLFETGRS